VRIQSAVHTLEHLAIDEGLRIRFVLDAVRLSRGAPLKILQLIEQSRDSRDLLLEPGLPAPAMRQGPPCKPASPEPSLSPELNNRPAHEIPAQSMKRTVAISFFRGGTEGGFAL
jgi:hypothetical protein